MQWTKPDFQEISLGMEATAYVNTDAVRPAAEVPASIATPLASRADDANASE